MLLQELGSVLRVRRENLGLSQDQLAKLVGLSRQTINGLENGTLEDLGFNRVNRVLHLLGLDMTSLTKPKARAAKSGLWMAAKSASVSYRGELTPDLLSQALLTGEIPTNFRPHVAYLL